MNRSHSISAGRAGRCAPALGVAAAAFALASITAGAQLPPPPPVITGIGYLGQYQAYSSTATLSLWRGVRAEIRLTGAAIQLARGAEVTTLDGVPVAGATARLWRFGGSTPVVTLRVDVETSHNVPLGTYLVRVRFPVETSGPASFRIRLFDRGVVNSITIDQGSASAVKVGERYTLTATGERLSNATVSAQSFDGAFRTVQVVQRSSTELKLSVEPATHDISVRIDASHFHDMDFGLPPSADHPSRYEGAGTITLGTVINPSPAYIRPSPVAESQPAAISGSHLAPSGYDVKLGYRMRYPYSTTLQFTPLTGTANQLTFTAVKGIQPSGLELHYTRTGTTQTNVIPFSRPLHVTATPSIGSLQTTQHGSFKTFTAGAMQMVGQHLIAPPGWSAPTVTFGGTPIPIASSSYSETAKASETAAAGGADVLTLTIPTLPQTTSAPLTIATRWGTTTSEIVHYVAAPRVTGMLEWVPALTGEYRPFGLQKLYRGARYALVGANLQVALTSVGTLTGGVTRSIAAATSLTLNGQPVPFSTLVWPASGDNLTGALSFSVPPNATSGTLRVTTIGGATSVASFTVEDRPPPLVVSNVSLTPGSVAGGAPATLTIAFAPESVPTSGTADVSVTSTEPGVVPSIDRFIVTSNPLVIQMATRPVATRRTVMLTVMGRSASLVVEPIRPVSVTLSPPTVMGSQIANAEVRFSAALPPGAPGIVVLSSSDPAVAGIETSAPITGDRAIVPVRTQVVGTSRTATITATLGGVASSATLTVAPPAVSSVATSPGAIVSGRAVNGTLTLAISPVAPVAVTMSSSDAAVRVPAAFSAVAATTAFPIETSPVAERRVVTITATANGQSKSTTLIVEPIIVGSLTILPATIAVGGTATGTVRLSAPSVGSQTVSVRTSDALVASLGTTLSAPLTLTFADGQQTATFPIRGVGPRRLAAAATITATMSRVIAAGQPPSISSSNATVTVTP